jgi:hypothetical protein
MSVRYRVEQNNGQDVVKEIHKVVVHTFILGDVEDPDLYAAEPLHRWENSEAGKWIMANAEDTPEWRRAMDHNIYGYRYAIIAELESKKLSEFYLRYGPVKK